MNSWEKVVEAIDAIPDTDATTTREYWDCECKESYIHPKTENICVKCWARKDSHPDARLREVVVKLVKEALKRK